LYAYLREPVNDEVADRFWEMVRRREQRQPVAYITETKEFWSLPLVVSPSVLIPRPETEIVVQTACEILARHRAPVVCDVGTGSGCIAVALACEHPTVRVVATDISPHALRIAHRNAVLHGVENRVELLCADLLEAVSPRVAFDLVVSNPPYVPARAVVEKELSHEPEGALFAGESGLDAIHRLVRSTTSRLAKGGHLVMELGDGQESAVRQITAAADLVEAEFRRDLGGIPRVLVARRAGGRNG
jgi:release factor glutamine methyltransferase